jgi:hypothetical protein
VKLVCHLSVRPSLLRLDTLIACQWCFVRLSRCYQSITVNSFSNWFSLKLKESASELVMLVHTIILTNIGLVSF